MSNKPFFMDILAIQPSQLYLNEKKVSSIIENFDENYIDSMEPVPIKKMDEKVFFTDGHTRTFVLWQKGYKKLKVQWEDEDLDWELYRICVKWCEDENIYTIADLKTKIIENDRYQIDWIQRCQNLYFKLYRNKPE